MSKSKYVVVIVVVMLTLAAGAGYWLWRDGAKTNKHQATSTARSSGGQTLAQTTDPNSIPLSSLQPPANSGSSLKLAPDTTANNIGQVFPNSSTSPPASPNSKSSNSSALDPSKFGEYEKYKNSESTLFGDMQVGSGTELTAGKKAAVYYAGWLTNGQLFDMSKTDKDGKLQPFLFTLGAHEVIPGWEQGLMGMKVGGTRLVIVPPALGYGAAGQGNIPGNSVLVFQVQLIAVQ